MQVSRRRDRLEREEEGVVCDVRLEGEWLAMMENGEVPVDEVWSAYNGVVPVFSEDFVGEVMKRLAESMEHWHRMLIMLLHGPVANLKRLDWDVLMQILIESIPSSCEVLSVAMTKGHECLQLLFVRRGGIEKLFKSDIANTMKFCADILRGLAEARVLFEEKAKTRQPLIELGKACRASTHSGLQRTTADMVYALCERLIASDNAEVRLAALTVLREIAEHYETERGDVAKTIAGEIERYETWEELMTAIEALNACGNVLSLSYLSPFLSKIPILLEHCDDAVAQEICHFLNNIVEWDSGDLIWDLGIVEPIILHSQDASFRAKVSFAAIAIKLTENFSPSRLTSLIPMGILPMLFDVLDADDPAMVADVQSAIRRIWDFVLHRCPSMQDELYKSIEGYNFSDNEFMTTLLAESQM